MTCRHVQHLHEQFIDGELPAGLMAEVHAHLLQCPACQRQNEMARAAASVIAKDQAEPQLDSGFASRVVASLPHAAVTSPVLAGRRLRRRRFWRYAAMASLPAAAAIVFCLVAIWPPNGDSQRPTRVAGASTAVEATGVQQVMEPTLDAVSNARQVAQNLNHLLKLSAGQAGHRVREGVADAAEQGTAGAPNATFMDVFLSPFNEVLQSPPPPTKTPDHPDLVRF